jgi:hypothetical protein
MGAVDVQNGSEFLQPDVTAKPALSDGVIFHRIQRTSTPTALATCSQGLSAVKTAAFFARASAKQARSPNDSPGVRVRPRCHAASADWAASNRTICSSAFSYQLICKRLTRRHVFAHQRLRSANTLRPGSNARLPVVKLPRNSIAYPDFQFLSYFNRYDEAAIFRDFCLKHLKSYSKRQSDSLNQSVNK